MKKKLFICEYFLEGLIVSAAATNYIPPHIFIMLFLAIFGIVYWKDGLQSSTIYYIPIAAGMLLGEAMQVQNISAYACIAVVYLQYIDTPVYHLPENKKLVGFRKVLIDGEDEEYFEFYPLVENGAIRKTSIHWDQGKAFQKIIESKQTKSLLAIYHRLSLSYIRKMPIVVGEGQQMPTQVGMAFCHGRDAAPMWYSSLLIHFASNNFKVGARQHANLIKFGPQDSKQQMKKRRQWQAKKTSQQYYQTIQTLNCEKLVLVAHSFGCSALLQAYHQHFDQLSSKVSHIILLDPYFFPLPDELLVKTVNCPVLVLSNQYLLNFEDVHQRFKIFTSKKNVNVIVWKEGTDLYQTDLCCFFSNQLKLQEWQSKFTTNFEAINMFMQEKKIENSFGDKDLGKKYRPEEYFPEHLFIF